MRVVDCDRDTEKMTLNDKVMGVFEKGEGAEPFIAATELAGAGEVEVLQGSHGKRCLQEVKQSVEGFLDAILGDMESGMLKVYLQALERGALVFAVPVGTEERDEVVRLAVQHGAKHIAHFGQLVNESFEPLTGDQPA